MKLKGLTEQQTADLFPSMDMLFVGYRGSVAHGMYVPSNNPDSIDDKDLMGVCFGKPEHYLGFGRRDVWEKFEGEFDVVTYEVRKLFSLLLKSNPNVLSLLWLDSKHIVYQHPLWREVLEARGAFVSKKAYHSFTGYAYSQLKRMENFKFEGYMGQKRKQLVERFGYDTKNAAHLIRLLRMGTEFLTEGRLHVEREDAAQLLQIKRGEWTLEQVKVESDKWFELTRQAYVSSSLPPEPDKTAVEGLLMAIVGEYHGWRKPIRFKVQV